MPVLDVRDLTIEYTAGDYVVRPIEKLNLRIEDGELVLLLGASGCGKTTLLSAMAAILTPSSGSIHIDESDITKLAGRSLTEFRRHGVGIVFQAFNLVPSLTALKNVAMPLWAAGVSGDEAKTRATILLEQVGMGERLHHRPGDLSGGQAQRVAIARALVHEPPLLLADEPTAHLDYIQVESVIQLLRTLAAPGRVVAIATHDERLLPIADRVVELTPRRATTNDPPAQVLLADGEVLFRQGDAGERVYVVESGRVELRRDTPNGYDVISIANPPTYFGELAPVFGLPRSATAVAVGPTEVSSLSVADFRRGMRVPKP